ncbi:MAG: tRNA (adenosine(37)-N6)-threonylcarbamoyltransferase complex dimerization subunit type 1 TsaB [Deltaproteobacteria bacterium]|nr:tRNA (adenosine(37)-N6)-threonylcarbamoyltransferase complex dimerization subunit type 1 TsaB [Deltaproteobacteria bacterium]
MSETFIAGDVQTPDALGLGWEDGRLNPAALQGLNALAVDTSSDWLALALLKEGRPAANLYARMGRRANRSLLLLLEELLAGAGLSARELHLLVAGIGPGSFTGTRIGMAVALTLAQVTGHPLIGVDALRVLASQARVAEGRRFHVLLNCAREEVYHAPFIGRGKGSAETLAPIRLRDMGELIPELAGEPVVLRRFQPDAPLGAFANLNALPLHHPHPDGLRLMALGLEQFLAAPAGPFPAPEPIYLKSEAFRTWRPAP